MIAIREHMTRVYSTRSFFRFPGNVWGGYNKKALGTVPIYPTKIASINMYTGMCKYSCYSMETMKEVKDENKCPLIFEQVAKGLLAECDPYHAIPLCYDIFSPSDLCSHLIAEGYLYRSYVDGIEMISVPNQSEMYITVHAVRTFVIPCLA